MALTGNNLANLRASLAHAQAFLDSGEEDKARDLAVRNWNCVPGDPALLRGWGEVCEELGMARQARHCYGQALKCGPDDPESLFRLGRLSAETGHYEDALRFLKKALRSDPDHRNARALLEECYRLLGMQGQAQAVSSRHAPDAPAPQPRVFPPSIGKKEAERLITLFSGREVGYAVQQLDPVTGETRFDFHNALLNHEIIAAHILGKITLAFYPLRSDNTVRHATLSICLPARLVRDNIKNRGYLGMLHEEVRSRAFSVFRFLRASGFPACIEECGDHRFRLWLFLETFIHFLKVRRFIDLLIAQLPGISGNIEIEPIAATRPAGIGWVEHPVPLPLGLQRDTLKRSLFLDDDGNPYPNQLAFLRKIRMTPPDRLTETLRGYHDSGFVAARKERPSSTKKLMARCPVVRELVRKAETGVLLNRDEQVQEYHAEVRAVQKAQR